MTVNAKERHGFIGCTINAVAAVLTIPVWSGQKQPPQTAQPHPENYVRGWFFTRFTFFLLLLASLSVPHSNVFSRACRYNFYLYSLWDIKDFEESYIRLPPYIMAFGQSQNSFVSETFPPFLHISAICFSFLAWAETFFEECK